MCRRGSVGPLYQRRTPTLQTEQYAARIRSRHVRFLADRVRGPRMQRTIRLQQQLQDTALSVAEIS